MPPWRRCYGRRAPSDLRRPTDGGGRCMRASQEEIDEMNRRHLAIARMMKRALEAVIAWRLKGSRSK